MNQKQAEHVEPGAAIVYQDSQGGTGAVLVKTVNREVAQPRCLYGARVEATDIYGVVWDVTISTREDPHEVTHVTEMVAGAEKMTVLGITNCKRGACRLDRG